MRIRKIHAHCYEQGTLYISDNPKEDNEGNDISGAIAAYAFRNPEALQKTASKFQTVVRPLNRGKVSGENYTLKKAQNDFNVRIDELTERGRPYASCFAGMRGSSDDILLFFFRNELFVFDRVAQRIRDFDTFEPHYDLLVGDLYEKGIIDRPDLAPNLVLQAVQEYDKLNHEYS